MADHEGLEYLTDMSHQVEQVWTRVLAAGVESGEYRANLDVRLTYRFVRDGVWSATRWYRPGAGYTISTIADEYLGMLQHGILAEPPG